LGGKKKAQPNGGIAAIGWGKKIQRDINLCNPKKKVSEETERAFVGNPEQRRP